MKLGAYICQGCGLGDRLNTSELARIAGGEGKAQVVREHEFLCNVDGIAMIQKDIDEQGVDHICIAACSRRAKFEAFSFDSAAVSRANLREGVIWVRPDNDEHKETTQEMAADYVRMGCAEVRHMTPPSPSASAAYNRRLLIVGGGISGMTAAIEASKAGYSATIVEKSDRLGGWLGRFAKRTPTRAPYADPQDTGIAAMTTAIGADPRITVHLNSTVTRTTGAPGRFAADITTDSGSTVSEDFGAIVQTSGFSRYDIAKLPELGGGRSADVVDQVGLEELAIAAGEGAIERPSDGAEVRSVTFVQCAGQRSDEQGKLPYCSGHCCATSIKQAMYFKARNPDIDTVILYTDLRTPGVGGEDFYRAGQRRGVLFCKAVVSEVDTSGVKPVVRFHDQGLDEQVAMESDLVVLATGQVANAGVNIDLATGDDDGDGDDEAEGVVVAAPSVLNLDYRQGRDVPQLRHGFADSHFICFPYETRRTGIYTAGPVRRPMDAGQAIEDATGATLKAIQVIENAALGRAAAPRSGDLSFPSFRKDGCTQCKRCAVECPFGAIDEDEQGFPLFNEARCRRCGTCLGACPVRVISFENYSVDSVGEQIKAVDMPGESDRKPRILVLACENDAYPAMDMAAQSGDTEISPWLRIIPVRCLGSVNMIWVTDALNGGYDGVVMMGCRKGESYQCHFVKGSELAFDRAGKLDETLKVLGLEPERVASCEVAITDMKRIPQILDDFAAKIGEIGMNPFKSP